MTWRAGALRGGILGLVCVLILQKSWWLVVFPALACGCWAAARIEEGVRARAADRIDAAGLAALLGGGILELGGTLEGVLGFARLVDNGRIPWLAIRGSCRCAAAGW